MEFICNNNIDLQNAVNVKMNLINDIQELRPLMKMTYKCSSLAVGWQSFKMHIAKIFGREFDSKYIGQLCRASIHCGSIAFSFNCCITKSVQNTHTK